MRKNFRECIALLIASVFIMTLAPQAAEAENYYGLPNGTGGPDYTTDVNKAASHDAYYTLDTDVVKDAGSVIGGYSGQNGVYGAYSNDVRITGSGSVNGAVRGGSSPLWNGGDASNNKVTIESGTFFEGVSGGFSQFGSTNGNNVTITGGSFDSTSQGAYGLYITGGNSGNMSGGSADSNDVTITGGNFKGVYYIYGGYQGYGGSASDNKVTIEDTTIGYVIGGYSSTGKAERNEVTIAGNSAVDEVIGAKTSMGTATGNTVNWRDGTIKSSIYGGCGLSTDWTTKVEVKTGNTLNMYAANKTVGELGGFENYNFYLPKDFATKDTMLTVNKQTALDLSDTSVEVYGLNSGTANLIKLDSGTITFTEQTSKSEFKEDLSTAGFYAIGNATKSIKLADGDSSLLIAELTPPKKDEEVISTTGSTLTLGTNDDYYAAAGGIELDKDVAGKTVTIDGANIGKEGAASSMTFTDGALFGKEGETVSVTFDNGSVYGAYTQSGKATDSTVNLEDGTINGSLYGAYSQSGSASGSTVNWNGGDINGALYGAYANGAESKAGSTLNMYASDKTVTTLGGFENYNFYLPEDFTVNKDTMLTVTGTNTVDLNNVTVGAERPFGGDLLKANDWIGLIGGNLTNTPTGIIYIKEGIDTIYNASLDHDTANNRLNAVIKSVTELSVDVYGTPVSGVYAYRVEGGTGSGDITATGGEYIVPTSADLKAREIRNAFGGYASTDGTLVSNNKVTANDKSAPIDGSLYGGYSEKGSATSNNVTVAGGSVTGNVFGGYAAVSGGASSNDVTISSGTIGGSVYGGYTNGGSAADNTVNWQGGDITDALYGGYDASAKAEVKSGNTLNMFAANKTVDELGGFQKYNFNLPTDFILASDTMLTVSNQNTLDLSGTSVEVNGLSSGTAMLIKSGKGTITFTDQVSLSEFKEDLTTAGNYVLGKATASIKLADSSLLVAEIIDTPGKDEEVISTTGSALTLGANDNYYAAAGGIEIDKDVTGKTVIISGAKTGSEGGAEKMTFTDGALFGKEGKVNVTFNNGDVYGGYTIDGSANGNKVKIENGTIGGDVYGGYSQKGSASDNTIDWYGGEIKGALYGGIAGTSTNNTLNMYAANKTVQYLGGFQNYNFYIPTSFAVNKDTMLKVNSGVDMTDGKVTVTKIAGGSAWKNGDKISLIKTAGSLTNAPTEDNITIDEKEVDVREENILTYTTYKGDLKATDNELYVAIKSDTPGPVPPGPVPPGPGPTPKPGIEKDAQAFSEGMASALLILDAAGDLVVERGMEAAAAVAAANAKIGRISDEIEKEGSKKTDAAAVDTATDTASSEGTSDEAAETEKAEKIKITEEKAPSPLAFGAFRYGGYRTETGSHVDSRIFSGMMGLSKEYNLTNGKLVGGVFFEGGRGNFDTYNDGVYNEIHGDGTNKYFGGGLLARYTTANNFYAEASLRVGSVRTKYNSNAATLLNAYYDTDNTYYGAHFGIGWIKELKNNATLEYYGKYFYSYTPSRTITLTGNNGTEEALDYDAGKSNRVRVGGRYTFAPEKNSVRNGRFYAGLAYEYEFSGDIICGWNYATPIPSPSTAGGSGIIEFGWKRLPTKNNNFGIDLGLEGRVGRTEGIAGNISLYWMFK